MCKWQKCHDAEIAERDAERAQGKLSELRTAIEDHRRGVLNDERILVAQRGTWQ